MNRAEEILNDFLEDDQAEDAIVSSTTYLSVKDVRTILNIYAKSQEDATRTDAVSIEEAKNFIKGEFSGYYKEVGNFHENRYAQKEFEYIPESELDEIADSIINKLLSKPPKTKDNEGA